jgi:hypothetical protein
MFLLDDILLAPFKGLTAVCRKVHEAAQEDLKAQEKEILATLADLYHELEIGRLDNDEFNSREGRLLDRLECLRDARRGEVEDDEAV